MKIVAEEEGPSKIWRKIDPFSKNEWNLWVNILGISWDRGTTSCRSFRKLEAHCFFNSIEVGWQRSPAVTSCGCLALQHVPMLHQVILLLRLLSIPSLKIGQLNPQLGHVPILGATKIQPFPGMPMICTSNSLFAKHHGFETQSGRPEPVGSPCSPG